MYQNIAEGKKTSNTLSDIHKCLKTEKKGIDTRIAKPTTFPVVTKPELSNTTNLSFF